MKYLGIPMGIFALDYKIKKKVDGSFDKGEKKEICDGKIILEKHYNRGAALNVLQDEPLVLYTLTAFMLGAIGIRFLTLLRKNGPTQKKIAYGMILGGGLSNFFDRITKGHVIDYIRFNVKNERLKRTVFNVSDFFIFAGAILTVAGEKNIKD